MTSNVEVWACDTGVAVAALDATHEAHPACRQVLLELRPALAGDAVFETYSVLTRLPPPLRLAATQAASVLSTAFPSGCWLDTTATDELWQRIPDAGIVGDAVYAALVGQAAGPTGELTRDRRAERTYRTLGVDYQFVD